MGAAFGKSLISQVKVMNVKYYKEQQQKNRNGDDSKEETLDILQVGEWTQKQDDSWKWFWSVVVEVMGSGMTKVREEQKQKKKGAAKKTAQAPTKEELMNMDFSAID